MESKFYEEKRILYEDGCDVMFFSMLFDVISDTIGPTCCMETDSVLRECLAFIRNRLASLLKEDVCDEYVLLGLKEE